MRHLTTFQQPKANVNSEAVDAWNARKFPYRRAHRGITEGSQQNVTKSSSGSQVPRSPIRKAKSRQVVVQSPGSLEQSDYQTIPSSPQVRARSEPLEKSSIQDLIVRVSQHSSLDRDLYIAYESSLSTQPTSKSFSHTSQSQSRLEVPNTVSQVLTGNGGIIPDSQPLPESSSYQPSTDNTSQSLTQYSQLLNLTQDAGDNETGLSVLSSNSFKEPTVQRKHRRSGSAPPTVILESTQVSLTSHTPPSLPRSVSDPTQIIHLPWESQQIDCTEVPDSIEKPSVSSAGSNPYCDPRDLSSRHTEAVQIESTDPRVSASRRQLVSSFQRHSTDETFSQKLTSQVSASDRRITREYIEDSQSQDCVESSLTEVPPPFLKPRIQTEISPTRPYPGSTSSSNELSHQVLSYKVMDDSPL